MAYKAAKDAYTTALNTRNYHEHNIVTYIYEIVNPQMEQLEEDITSGKVDIEEEGDFSPDFFTQEYKRSEYKAGYTKVATNSWNVELDRLHKIMREKEKLKNAAKEVYMSATKNINEVEKSSAKLDEALFKPYNVTRLYHILQAFNVTNDPNADIIQANGINKVIITKN